MSDLLVQSLPTTKQNEKANLEIRVAQAEENNKSELGTDTVEISSDNKEIVEKKPLSTLDKILSPFKFVWGLTKGFVKEAFNFLGFFLGFITSPIQSIKNLFNGLKGLGHLILNPNKAVDLLKQTWKNFKEADADKKGEIIGRIALNLSPTGLLLNVKTISNINRIIIGMKAIRKKWDVIKHVYKNYEKGKGKAFRAAWETYKNANFKADLKRSFQLENIPKELQPKYSRNYFVEVNNNAVFAYYEPAKHSYGAPFGHRMLSPSGYMGGFIRHEVKHAGQNLIIARAGLTSSLPKEIALKAREIAPILPGSKLYKKAKKYESGYESWMKVNQEFASASMVKNIKWRTKGLLSPSFMKAFLEYKFAFIKYKLNLFEREAFWSQAIYTRFMPPIPLPSIHNLPRLANVENKSIEKKDSRLNQAA